MMKLIFKNLENKDVDAVVKHISNNIFKIGSVYSKIIARKVRYVYSESVFEFLVDDTFRESNIGEFGLIGKLNNPSLKDCVEKMNGLNIPVTLFVPEMDSYNYIISYSIIDGDLCHNVKRG